MKKNVNKESSMGIYFLLDRSGSMSNLWSEAISSINAYINNVKSDQELNPKLGDAKIIVATFDTEYEIIRNTTVSKWVNVEINESHPRGGTALYDNAARLIHRAIEDNNEKAIFITMTDGYENMSREYNAYTFKTLLTKFESKGYQVVFLGANFDVVKQAGNVGVGMAQTLSFAPGMFTQGMNYVGSSTAAYRSSGASMAWTDQDRVELAKTK